MVGEKVIELKPIKESSEDFDVLEKRIKELFKKELYFPLLKELKIGHGDLRLTNDNDKLLEALRSGRVTFSKGSFSGKFNSSVSKELKKLGATWDRKSSSFKLQQRRLPPSVREVIGASEVRFQEKLAKIDRRLGQILPEQIADKLKSSDLFDRTLWKTNKNFAESVKHISVPPSLSDKQRARIADEWSDNMKIWIKDFSEKEIKSLREQIKSTAFSGNRYESMISTIQKSYDVTANKAKFLARQETALLMTKFKETRYADAGVQEYKWGCVTGTKFHPVRPWHKKLEGKIFRFDDPPITTAPGESARKNNPGEDFNCRCFAKPIVRFKK